MRKRMRFGGPITQPVVVAISRSPYGADRSELHPLLSRINASVMWWIRKKYKRLRTIRKAAACWQRVTSQHPRLFAHWAWRTGQVRAVALGTSGMSDPNAGRYLEAWLPSNLIWDRFPVRLDIQITAALAAHSIDQRKLSPESMPTNGRCSSRSTTHRCHTCCLRIHATTFRTLQD